VSLFAPLAALAWEHFRPQAPVLPEQEIARGQRWLLDHFNAGGVQHGMLAWILGALIPAIVLGLFASGLSSLLEMLGWAYAVLVLYFLLGFRQASFNAARIGRALIASDLADARASLIKLNPGLVPADTPNDLIRQSLEETFRVSLTNLFGVLFWYWVAGIAGAVLYSLSHSCRDQWQSEAVFAGFSQQAVHWLDWLPARTLGFSFAIVGNFQDATECWRSQASLWLSAGRDGNEGVILASGAGALGIRLGGTIQIAGSQVFRPELGIDEAPGAESIEAGVALIWRAALLWISVAGLLWLGSL
jgi:adenosylcobinamide-phosphate synthase